MKVAMVLSDKGGVGPAFAGPSAATQKDSKAAQRINDHCGNIILKSGHIPVVHPSGHKKRIILYMQFRISGK